MGIMKLTVYGTAQTKGSMTCIGARGKRGHTIIESDPRGEKRRWRERITSEAQRLIATHPNHFPIDTPIVRMVAFLPRPKTNTDPYPIRRSSGDADKQQRMLLDALDDAGAFTDDSHVISQGSEKRWTPTGSTPHLVAFLAPYSKKNWKTINTLIYKEIVKGN